jgi:hypothetical protein
VQAIGRQPLRAPVVAPAHYERHRPQQTTQYRLVQQHAATSFAQAEAAAGAEPAHKAVVADCPVAGEGPGPRLSEAALRRLPP